MVSIFIFIGCVSATFALVSKASLSGGSLNGWRFLGSKLNPVHRLNVLRFEVAAVVEAGVAGNFVGVDFISLRRLLSAAMFVFPMMKDVSVGHQLLVRSSVFEDLVQAVDVEAAAFKVPSAELLVQVFAVLDSVVEVSGKTPSGKQMSSGSPFFSLWGNLVEEVSEEASAIHGGASVRVAEAATASMVMSKSRKKLVS